jgi:hypothetical protein
MICRTAYKYTPPSSNYSIFASNGAGLEESECFDEELYVDGRTAVWRTLGTAVVRKRFSFGTPVLQAMWCNFEGQQVLHMPTLS